MKVILVSGGTSVLGAAICRHYIERGDRVLCAYHTNAQGARHLAGELGQNLVPVSLDVQSADSIEQAVTVIERLDVLVNNSGIFSEAAIEDLTLSQWRRIFSVNVEGMFALSQACRALLRAASGAIVNIASINALHPGFGKTVHYDASKGAVIAFTQSLAAELAPEIRVNAVAPGLLSAPHLDTHHRLRRLYEERALLGILVDPSEVARTVAFVGDCRAMTAQTVVVDGGYLAG